MSNVNNVGRSSGVQYGASVDGMQKAGPSPALLPEPGDSVQLNGDVMAHLAELLTKANQTDKRMSRDLENKANRAQAEADKARIAEMRAKAEADKAAGLADGWGDIVAGGLTLGSAVCAGFEKTPDERTTTSTGFDGWTFGSKSFDAGAKLATGGAKLVSTGYKDDGDEANVQAASAENASRAAERAAKNAHEDVQDAREAIKKVAEFLDKMQQAANGTMQTAATFRA